MFFIFTYMRGATYSTPRRNGLKCTEMLRRFVWDVCTWYGLCFLQDLEELKRTKHSTKDTATTAENNRSLRVVRVRHVNHMAFLRYVKFVNSPARLSSSSCWPRAQHSEISVYPRFTGLSRFIHRDTELEDQGGVVLSPTTKSPFVLVCILHLVRIQFGTFRFKENRVPPHLHPTIGAGCWLISAQCFPS